ncbi:MAG: hypothetical protein V7633_2826, partial [Pseudonocardia sp.]
HCRTSPQPDLAHSRTTARNQATGRQATGPQPRATERDAAARQSRTLDLVVASPEARGLRERNLGVWSTGGYYERRVSGLDGVDDKVGEDQGDVVAVRSDDCLVKRKAQLS